MSFSKLLNKRCSWKRRFNVGQNEYGEINYSDVIIGSDVECGRQVGLGMNMRQLVQNVEPGEFNRKVVKYWMYPTDIQEGDIIKFQGSELEKVEDVRDAAGRGHHLEILSRSIVEVGEEDGRSW